MHLAIFDITGGILTAAGLSMVGLALLWKRGKIIKQFEAGLDRSKEQFHQELQAKLSVDFRGVYNDIEKVFQGFFDYLRFRQEELNPQLKLLAEIKTALLALHNEVNGRFARSRALTGNESPA
jgi:hypothetical protein